MKTKLFCSIILFTLLSFSAESMIVYGHRGARGLAPESTILGFEVALAEKVDAIDLDIAMTKDGVLVVYHDLVLNPDITRDAAGNWVSPDANIKIKDLTLEQLQTYDVGRIRPGTTYAATYPDQVAADHLKIPTLKAVVQMVKASARYPVGFQIEIKSDPRHPELSVPADVLLQALNQILIDEGISDRTKVQAYDWQYLLSLQQLNPVVETAYLTDMDHQDVLRHIDPLIAGQWTAGYLLKDYNNSIPDIIYALGGSWWDVEDIALTEPELKRAHALGLKVAVWTYPERNHQEINVPLLRRLIEMGVDGVITDRPDIVRILLYR